VVIVKLINVLLSLVLLPDVFIVVK